MAFMAMTQETHAMVMRFLANGGSYVEAGMLHARLSQEANALAERINEERRAELAQAVREGVAAELTRRGLPLVAPVSSVADQRPLVSVPAVVAGSGLSMDSGTLEVNSGGVAAE